MIDSENIFEIYEEILFRELRPAVLVERFEVEGFETFELLWDEPKSLHDFIAIKKELGVFNKGGMPDNDYVEKEVYFQNPFAIDINQHPLFRFYVHLIQFERKCIQQEIERMVETGAKTWVKYQLSVIVDGLLGLLKDCVKTNVFHITNNNELTPIDQDMSEELLKLNTLVQRCLFTELVAMYSDLKLQYDHFDELPFPELEKLFLTELKRSTDYIPMLGLSQEGIEFTLSRIMEKDKKLEEVERLLKQHYEILNLPNLIDKSIWENVYFHLENLWLYLNLIDTEVYDFSEKSITKQLKNVMKKIKDGEASQDVINVLIGLSKTSKQRFRVGCFDSNNVAARLLNLQAELNKAQVLRTPDSANTKDEGNIYQPTTTSKTDQALGDLSESYIELNLLPDMMDIPVKLFRKCIKDSGVELLRFSKKKQYIHKNEYEKLLSYYTSNEDQEKK